MDRNQFIKNAGLLSAGVLLKDLSFAQAPESFLLCVCRMINGNFTAKQ